MIARTEKNISACMRKILFAMVAALLVLACEKPNLDDNRIPEEPEESEMPGTPDGSGTPETPDENETPETPDENETPDVPEEPSFPDLSSDETANSYIVSSAGTYRFRADVKGNGTESVGTPASAEVLWETFGSFAVPEPGDLIADVRYEDGFVVFSTPETLVDGNALIAVKDEDGAILWSWHIWICEGFDPVETQQVYANEAGIMMDRDLGATSAVPGDARSWGLFYQWGRKDPFMGNGSSTANTGAAASVDWPSTVQSGPETGTVEFTVRNPMVFIENSNQHWHAESDMSLWKDDKTEYDPCPPGWKVPTGGGRGFWAKAFKNYNGEREFKAPEFWLDDEHGMLFPEEITGTPAWYPASAYINSVGKMERYYNGQYGYRWSVTEGGTRAYVFSILHSWAYTTPVVRPYSETFPCATATAVRCCRDE